MTIPANRLPEIRVLLPACIRCGETESFRVDATRYPVDPSGDVFKTQYAICTCGQKQKIVWIPPGGNMHLADMAKSRHCQTAAEQSP